VPDKNISILVCGGRDFDDAYFISYVMLRTFNSGDTLIEGGAKGADLLAKRWAIKNNIEVKTFEADWNKYGKRAGFIRNSQMLKEGKPDLVIAFPGGKGTDMMVGLAKDAGVDVLDLRNRTKDKDLCLSGLVKLLIS
jgi:hypothetical protein